jgi:hypothetical protein
MNPEATRVGEAARRQVPVPESLGPCHNFGRVRFIVRLSPTNLSEISPAPPTSPRTKREPSSAGFERAQTIAMMVPSWLKPGIRLERTPKSEREVEQGVESDEQSETDSHMYREP